MTARDELAYELAKLDGEGWVFEPPILDGFTREGHAPEVWLRRADAILAAGYRKPRTITTVQELHALPTDTVIRTVFGAVFVKDGGWWAETGTRDKSLSVDLDLPATVLYEPEPQP